MTDLARALNSFVIAEGATYITVTGPSLDQVRLIFDAAREYLRLSRQPCETRESVVKAMALAIMRSENWGLRIQAEAALDAALDLIDQEQLVEDVRSFVAVLRAGKGSDE